MPLQIVVTLGNSFATSATARVSLIAERGR